MSAPLSDEEVEHYTSIIDGILATADLETVTRKKIRQGLETALGGQDLSTQKDAIKKLIEARFDAISGADVPPSSVADSSTRPPTSNGASDDADADADAPTPTSPKAKRSSSVEDADARLAAQLQAQENSLARSRTTRGGNDKAKTSRNKKAAPRKKSAKRVNPDDDSDVGSGESAPKKKKTGGGFQKPFLLSQTLSELCGETTLSRPQVVKKLWDHIKSNELQDPKDKRQILCDDKMQAVFKQAKVDMFRMNKEIGNHLYPVEE